MVRTNFSADFWTFRNFWWQFRENCGPTWRRKWEPCSAPDRAIISEETLKMASKSMSPTRRQTKYDIQKHQFSLLQPTCIVRSPQTLHADRERRDNSRRCQSFFDPMHSFSCRGENADFWSLMHWVNLIPSGCHGNLPVIMCIYCSKFVLFCITFIWCAFICFIYKFVSVLLNTLLLSVSFPCDSVGDICDPTVICDSSENIPALQLANAALHGLNWSWHSVWSRAHYGIVEAQEV